MVHTPGARCFTRISSGFAHCRSAFWSRAVSGAPLIHRSRLPSHHPNAQRRVPSSRALPTIAPCVVAHIPHPAGARFVSRASPWRERKSQRGKPKTICTAGYACPNPDCDYFGNTDSTFHALVGDGISGSPMWHPAKPVGKSPSTCCMIRSRNPIAAVSLGSSVACAWAIWLTLPTSSRHSGSLAPSTSLSSNAFILPCGMRWPLCRRRRSWATAQLTGELLIHLEWWRAYHHFCRPHLSLRRQPDGPQARRGQQTPRRYAPRTPAQRWRPVPLITSGLCRSC